MTEDEKTLKEKRVQEKTDPAGLNTLQGLAGLEISEVEIVEKTLAGKKVVGDTPTRPENRPTPEIQTRVNQGPAPRAPSSASLRDLSYQARRRLESARDLVLRAWNDRIKPLFSGDTAASPSVTQLLDHFGPTILVCVLFFFWVIYDRSVRPRPSLDEIRSDKMVLGAMKELSKGNRAQAESLILGATKLTRDREKLERLREILEDLE